MGKFAYHVTIRNAASAVYAKIFESINDHRGTNLNRKFMKVDKSFINYNFLGSSYDECISNCRKKIKINIIYSGHRI